MKLSKLSAACLLATLSASNAYAGLAHEKFEFNGYLRQGFLLSAENDFKDADFPAQKETLGRLGLEADNQSSVDLASVWDFGDGRKMRIGAGIESGRNSNGGSGFVQFDGFLPSGTLSAGKLGYGKERYIFMTDFYYTDMSGTGVVVENYQVGDALVNAAFLVSERTYDGDEPNLNCGTDKDCQTIQDNLNNYMHALNFAVKYQEWDVSATFKAMPDNWDRKGNEYAESGFDITAVYAMDSFFGVNSLAAGGTGSSYTNIIMQAGVGLGSGNLLGGTITSYNAYHPGSLRQGEHEFEWGEGSDAISLLTQVDDDDKSARLLVWGAHSFDNGVSIFPSIQGQYNWHAEGTYDYWASAMMRAAKGISANMYLQGEIGFVHNDWDGGTWNQGKITIAPTYIMPTGTEVNPEIRFFASYITDAWSVDPEKGHSDNDFIIGMQADVFW